MHISLVKKKHWLLIKRCFCFCVANIVRVCDFFSLKLSMELLLLFGWRIMFSSDTKSETASFLLSYFMAVLSLNHAHLIWCLSYCWWEQDRLEVFRSIKKNLILVEGAFGFWVAVSIAISLWRHWISVTSKISIECSPHDYRVLRFEQKSRISFLSFLLFNDWISLVYVN